MESRKGIRSVILTVEKRGVRFDVEFDDSDWEVVSQYEWRIHTVNRSRTFYARVAGQGPLMHRLLLGLGRYDGEVDHIDQNGLNNKRSNLRVVTHAQNMQNVSSHRGASSQYRGVFLNKGKWVAVVRQNGKNIILGRFENELDAAAAAAEMRRISMPFSE